MFKHCHWHTVQRSETGSKIVSKGSEFCLDANWNLTGRGDVLDRYYEQVAGHERAKRGDCDCAAAI